MVYTIYALVDPRDYRFYYVGLTSDPKRRYLEHRDGRSYGQVWQRSKELKAAGIALMMVTLETQPDVPQAIEAETRSIALLRSLGYALVNSSTYHPGVSVQGAIRKAAMRREY